MKVKTLKIAIVVGLLGSLFLFQNFLVRTTTTTTCPTGQSLYRNMCMPNVTALTSTVKTNYGITRFYGKQLVFNNHVVLGTSYLPNKNLQEAAYIVYRMTQKTPSILTWLANNKIRTSIINRTEHTLDIPEYVDVAYPVTYSTVYPFPDQPWFERRGLGATTYYKTTLSNSDNLLCSTSLTGSAYPPAGSQWPYYDLWRDDFGTESILIHEFGHTVHLAIKNTNPSLATQISNAYANAKAKGLWKGTYAMQNVDEYFAETSQSWFNANKKIPAGYALWGVNNQWWNRSSVKANDPVMAGILDQIYGQYWTWTCP